MQCKLSDASFSYDDAEGKTQTVKGSLVINLPEDGNVNPGHDLGGVSFVTAPLTDAQAEKQAQAQG